MREHQTFVAREDLAELLDRAGVRVSVRTLERWASQGIGPRPVKVGPRRIRYIRSEVTAWLATLDRQSLDAEKSDVRPADAA